MVKILRVDLSAQRIEDQIIENNVYRQYLGGRGLGAYLLYNDLAPQTDPLSQDNELIVAAGPLTGTMAPTAARAMVVTKSPLTGFATSSNVGGYFGTQLKMAGYEAIVIKGKSEKPVYIFIHNNRVYIKDASHIWGLSTSQSDMLLREETNLEASAILIGPAGENLSIIASLMVDGHRAAGRSGVGAVMGSKFLKGIVVYGTKGIEINNENFYKVSLSLIDKIKISAGTKRFRENGTTGVLDIINGIGALPTHNYRDGHFKDAALIDHRAYNKKLLDRNGACANCPIGCMRLTSVKSGKFAGQHGGGPEYETLWAYGASCGVKDLNYIAAANYIANEMGLDTISMGSTIASLFDLFEAGYVKGSDIGNITGFGDKEAIVQLTEMTGKNTGIGELLAKGSHKMARHFGHPEFSMSVKSQEMPAYDPRGIKGMGLAYATSNRGACHTKAFTVAFEVYNAPYSDYRLEYKGKDKLVKDIQDYQSVVDASGTCSFGRGVYNIEVYAELLNALLGFDYTPSELLLAGERIWNIEHVFNMKAGWDKDTDTLPRRIFESRIKTGASQGEFYNRKEFEKLLENYYALRGWSKTGIPGKDKLQELGIG